MRERRIAGAQDAVGRHVRAQFLLHRALDIDIAQHAETLGLERRCRLREGLVERQARERGGESVHVKPQKVSWPQGLCGWDRMPRRRGHGASGAQWLEACTAWYGTR